MKIVDYNTFIHMPPGTIFVPCDRVYCDDFEIKVDEGRQFGDSWIFCGTMPLKPWNIGDLLCGYPEKATFEVYDGDSTDASAYDQFYILEQDDIDELIKVLHWAKDGCPGDLEDYKKESEPT